jgi:hypothetical protein
VGEEDLVHALSAFVASWRQEQDRLTASILRSKTLAATAAAAYQRLDQALAGDTDTAGRAGP